mgnify:CR=1 FL=1
MEGEDKTLTSLEKWYTQGQTSPSTFHIAGYEVDLYLGWSTRTSKVLPHHVVYDQSFNFSE